ncbi:Ammonium transporter 1 [Ceratocystis lukuohia]|uniref:Ammonium transporter n=3 Tax=Ceratocystis TaxID=5157 RepID=A0A0F8B163_CERFI|nr:Ammonium transporter 1 [Ceratocystis platani]PHH54955.1 Ammonium transporter 1 [Ceratocystis fimbriata CBS 114723]
MSLEYNGTEGVADPGYSTGVADLNLFYEPADLCWVMISSALVLLMIPGVAFFYAGLARRKSALHVLFSVMLVCCVACFQWFFWGFSLTFSSESSSIFLGNLANFGFRDVLAQPSGPVPQILFALFQGMFAMITPALAIGAITDRGRVLPAVVFTFIWCTVVYDPVAYWTWNSQGWLFEKGSLDFAGGGPVHMSSGIAALAYSLMLGRRTGYAKMSGLPYRPHNVTHIVLGTILLWVGWFGFNGGSALASNLRAIMACFVSNLAAAVGGITWCLLDLRIEKKWSCVGFCSGVVAGLVAITPGAGFVTPWAAVIFGIVGAAVCNFSTKLKFLVGIDDALDVFALHGMGGFIGNVLTGVFADKQMAALDGTEIEGGWVEGNYKQIGWQLAGCAAILGWVFSITCIILFVMNLIPGLSLRVSAEEEEMGLDDGQLGEFAYDYVEVTRHISGNGLGLSGASTAEKV